MTEQQVFVKMILNSMRISANLAVHPMVAGLVQMDIIPKDVLARTELKPDIRLVKAPQQSVPVKDGGTEVDKSCKGAHGRTANEDRRKAETEVGFVTFFSTLGMYDIEII